MPRFLMALAAFVVVTAPAFADETTADRDRRAKAAIAIAKSITGQPFTGVATAPEPRQVHADLTTSPIVVYVGYTGPQVDGAITFHKGESAFGDVKGPALVICHPEGDRLVIDAVLPQNSKSEDILRAVENAAKKMIANPKSMPKCLDTKISAKTGCACDDGCKCGQVCKNPLCDCAGGKPCVCGSAKVKAACICGDACKCKEGDCPAKCLVAVQPAPVVIQQPACRVEYFYGTDGRLYQRTVCPNQR